MRHDRSVVLAFRGSQELKRRLRAAAVRDGRLLGPYLRRLVEQALNSEQAADAR